MARRTWTVQTCHMQGGRDCCHPGADLDRILWARRQRGGWWCSECGRLVTS